jgi:rhodanese-related sulfurtransferase
MKTLFATALTLILGWAVGLPAAADCGGCAAKTPAAAPVLSLDAFQGLIASDRKPTVLDVLSPEAYHRQHIAGALNVPLSQIDSLHAKLPKDGTIVTYCAGPGCPASARAAERLLQLGFKDVRAFEGGIAGWTKAGLPVVKGEPVRFVSRDELAGWRRDQPGLVVIDVLPAEWYAKSHIAGAINIPLADVERRAADLDKNARTAVYCANYIGSASTQVTLKLTALGFKDVSDYKGGLHEWKEANLPLAGSEVKESAKTAGASPASGGRCPLNAVAGDAPRPTACEPCDPSVHAEP